MKNLKFKKNIAKIKLEKKNFHIIQKNYGKMNLPLIERNSNTFNI